MTRVAMICFTAGCLLWPVTGGASDKVRIGLSALSPTNWAVWVGEEVGLFKKHGVEPEVIYIGGGGARGVNALLANEVQFMAIGGVGVVNAVLRGADLVMIASNVNLGTQRIMASPSVKTPKDLTGKRVGVTAFGSNTHSILLMLLKRWSMAAEDLKIIQVGPSPTLLISLQKGWIDAAVVTAPTDFAAEDLGFRTLVDVAEMRFPILQSTISTRREYLRSSEARVVQFVKGYSESIALIKKNKSVAVEILKKRLRMDDSQVKYLDKTYHRYASLYLDRVPYVASAGVQNLLDFLEKDNPKANTTEPSMFVDARVVKTLEQSGFYKSLYR